MRKPRFESPRRRKFDSEIDKNMTWKQAWKKKRFVKHFGSQKLHKQVSKSLQNQQKSCYLQLRVHPAPPMVLQGSPEVPK